MYDIDVQVDDSFAVSFGENTEEFVVKFASHVLNSLHVSMRGLSIVVSGDDFLSKLNFEYLGKNGATNVLSFPSDDGDAYLGDIAISVDTVMKESKECEISAEEHFAHMILHGILHLIGYDHVSQEDASKMEAMESKIMIGAGYKDPHDVSRVTI